MSAAGVRRRRSQFPAKSYDRFARTHGEWRPVVGEVADKFLACGVLDHGFARIRCGGTMRIVACITARAVIDRMLTHLRTRAAALTG